ncbi:hypothetical protein LZ009_14355 [Ramlibacter sp. XY19]|uniref:hypothetical protein n=1 Tax=Ramlibacter paludis TaxID=2908000 RepID=UPI0023DC9AC1|nr:hypothetical protein [Ramlibacter paludis]MCG2593960.1 hypothetical protein [Ramlibacter paludis]
MTEAEALAFVEQHGVVLVSAQGAAPKLVDAIAGEPVRGSWWGHPRGKEIFRVLSAVQASPDILVCRLLAGKLTLVHRRLWPALVRLADRFAPERIERVREEHTASGKHVSHEEPFPAWVPAQVLAEAERMAHDEAERLLGAWAPR